MLVTHQAVIWLGALPRARAEVADFGRDLIARLGTDPEMRRSSRVQNRDLDAFVAGERHSVGLNLKGPVTGVLSGWSDQWPSEGPRLLLQGFDEGADLIPGLFEDVCAQLQPAQGAWLVDPTRGVFDYVCGMKSLYRKYDPRVFEHFVAWTGCVDYWLGETLADTVGLASPQLVSRAAAASGRSISEIISPILAPTCRDLDDYVLEHHVPSFLDD